MKKRSLLLCCIALFSLVFSSCSYENTTSRQEDQSEIQSDLHATESEFSLESELEPESESEPEPEHIPQVYCVVASNAPSWEYKQISLGSEEQLNKWSSYTDNFENISKIIISNVISSEKELSKDETIIFLDCLRSLSPTIMEEDSNPSSELDVYIYAYENQEEIWRISIGGFGMVIEFPNDDIQYRFEVDNEVKNDINSFVDN